MYWYLLILSEINI